MEISTNRLHKGWKVGDTVRIVDQGEHSENQYVITDYYPEYLPKVAILDKLSEEEEGKECTFRIFTNPDYRVVSLPSVS